LGGGVLALLLVAMAVQLLSGPLARLAALYGSQYHFRGLGVASTTALLALAVLLGWAGSWLAASRHIRAIEPS
jgi:cell division transport system permease protein